MKPANSETVLITGASSGIGLELAKCFAADGSRLVLIARNESALKTLAEELQRTNKIETIVIAADLSLPETPKRIFRELAEKKISIDVLVNNAGFGLHETFVNLPLQQQLEIIQVNVTALVELTGLFLPQMISQNRGGVLNVGSVAGFLPGPNMAVYYASKAFVQSFTEALAEELSETKLKICVLCPGPTESNFGRVARGGKTRKSQTPKMSAQSVAAYGHQAFRRGKVVSIPGISNKSLTVLIRILTRSAVRKTAKRYNRLDFKS